LSRDEDRIAAGSRRVRMLEVHISRSDLRNARIVDTPPPPLAAGDARLRLDLFALTSNNITYAAFGEGMLGYWDFFPGPEGWGRPPVWGFATAVQSNAPGIEEGARFYGYFPISEMLDVTPVKAGPAGFADGALHRAAKASVYNQYFRTATDRAYDAAFEPEQALFRPLYGTGWWLADCVQQDRPGTVAISSASSKTALATAHQLRKLGAADLVALTSARNEAYVRETGLYHRVVTYDVASALTAKESATYVDILGRDALRATVHLTLDASLKRSILVGAADWSDKAGGALSPSVAIEGPKPEFFFVPAYAAGRLTANPELGEAMQEDLRNFYAGSRAFVTARRRNGADAILESWLELADGSLSPRDGLVLSF
jgi:hypothetical protein